MPALHVEARDGVAWVTIDHPPINLLDLTLMNELFGAIDALGRDEADGLDARQAGGDVQAGDAAGVERPHGQLRARLADRLGGDDAHCLTRADHAATGQVPAVARAADAVARLAGQR